MRRIHLLFTAICLLFLACKPEEVIKPSPPSNSFVFGGEGREASFGSMELADGNFVFVGSAKKATSENYNLQIITVSPTGEEILTRDYPGSQFDESGHAIIAIPGGYAVAGYQYNSQSQSSQVKIWSLDQDFELIKESVTAVSNIRGSRSFINSFYALANGNYILGFTYTSEKQVLIFDPDFSLIESKFFTTPYSDANREFLKPVPNGFMAVYTQDNYDYYGGVSDIFINFWDENGVEQWASSSTVTGTNRRTVVNGFSSLSDGTLVATIGQDNEDGIIVRMDSAGNVLSSTSLGNSFITSMIRELPSGNLIIGGNSLNSVFQDPNSSNNNMVLMEVDSSDAVLWSANFGGRESDSANDLLISSTGAYILTGTSLSYGLGESDSYMVIYNR